MAWTSLIILVLPALVITPARAGGRVIDILMRDSAIVTGELLALRDTALIITPILNASEALLEEQPGSTSVVPFRNIARVTSEGKSHVLLGFGLGLVAGIGISAVIAGNAVDHSSWDAEISTTGDAIGAVIISGLAGATGGALVGLAASSPDLDLTGNQPDQLKKLRKSARYDKAEPPYLQTRK